MRTDPISEFEMEGRNSVKLPKAQGYRAFLSTKDKITNALKMN